MPLDNLRHGQHRAAALALAFVAHPHGLVRRKVGFAAMAMDGFGNHVFGERHGSTPRFQQDLFHLPHQGQTGADNIFALAGIDPVVRRGIRHHACQLGRTQRKH